jgi:hypothetical protein
MSAGIGNKSESIDYGSLKSKVDLIFGTGSGTSGYGQPISSPTVQTNDIITAESWQLLRNDMVKARQHQTGITVGTSSTLDNNNLIPIYNGTLITEAIRNQYEKFSNAIVMDKHKVHPSQLTNQVLVTGHRTTSWANTITHSVIISASSAGDGASENLRYFFNAGGTITIQSSRINGTTSTVNNLWSNLLNSCGNISLSLSTTSKSGNNGNASSIGFINLSTTNQIIFHNTRSGATASDTLSFKVSAMVDNSRTQIFLTIEYSNSESTVAGDNFSKNINGDLYSIVSQNVPSGSNVNVYTLSATHSGIDLGMAPIRYRLLPSITSQNEGGVVTYTTECSEPGASTLYWRTIGNVTSVDFEDNILSGSVTLDNDGVGIISRTIAQDFVSEGNEQFYIQLYNTQDVVLSNSLPVNINDTTIYSMIVSSYYVSEGGSINFTIDSSNRAIGNTLYVTLSGTIDANDIVGGLNRTLVFTSNSVTSTITIATDTPTDSDESFVIQCRVGSYSGPIVIESKPITINDTSPKYKIILSNSSYTNNIPGRKIFSSGGVFSWIVPQWVSSIKVTLYGAGGGSGGPLWSGGKNGWYGGWVGAGGPGGNGVIRTFTINVIPGSTVSGVIGSGGGPGYGYGSGNGGAGGTTSLTYGTTYTASGGGGGCWGCYGNSGGVYPPAQAYGRGGAGSSSSYGTGHAGNPGAVDIEWTANEYISYPYVDASEGNSVNFSVNTINVPNGTIVYYNPIGNVSDSDFTGGMYGRYLTINNGVGSGSITILKDSIPEGLETFNIQLRTGGQQGTVVDTSTTINISPSGSLLFTTAGYTNWTVPTGVTSINYTLVSGGGGGGTGSGDDDGWSGGGGGSGGIFNGSIKVSPGNVLTICVGYGGQRSAAGGESAIYVNGSKISAISGGSPGNYNRGGTGGASGGNGGGGGWADDDNDYIRGGSGGVNSTGYGNGGTGGAFYSGAYTGHPGSSGMVSIAW